MKTKQVEIPIDKWCKLCDVLSVPPDVTIEVVIQKATALNHLNFKSK